MSFGFSVGDFVALIQLAKATYKNCVEAGPEYNEIAREIRSLHSVLKPLRDEVDKPDSGIFRQDTASAEELRKSIDGCNHILEDLQILLAKYEGLSNAGEAVSSSKKLWHRLRFSTKIEQLAAVRAKLISYTSTISVLLDAVQLKATGRVENKIDNVSSQMAEGFESLKKVILDMAVKARAEQRGGSTLSLLSLSTYAGDDKEVWREFRRELIGMGFRSKSLDRHKDLLQAYMLKLDQSGVLDEVGASSGQHFMDPWWKKHAFSETVHTLSGPQVINEKVSGKIPTPPPPEYSVTDGNKSNLVSELPSSVDQELADPNIGQSINLQTINDLDMPDSKGKPILTSHGATIPDLNLTLQTDSEESEKETTSIRRRRRPRVKKKSRPRSLNADLTDSMVDAAKRIASEIPPISSEYEGNPSTKHSASMSSTDITPPNMNDLRLKTPPGALSESESVHAAPVEDAYLDREIHPNRRVSPVFEAKTEINAFLGQQGGDSSLTAASRDPSKGRTREVDQDLPTIPLPNKVRSAQSANAVTLQPVSVPAKTESAAQIASRLTELHHAMQTERSQRLSTRHHIFDQRPVILTTGSDLPTTSQPKRHNIDMATAQKARAQRVQNIRKRTPYSMEVNEEEYQYRVKVDEEEHARSYINTWLRESSENPLVATSQESERLTSSNSRAGDVQSRIESPKASRPTHTAKPARPFPIQAHSDSVPRFGTESRPQAQRRPMRDQSKGTTTSGFGAVAMGLAGLSLILGMRRRNKAREARGQVVSDGYYDYYSDSFTQTSDSDGSDDSDFDNDSVRDLYSDGKRRGELFRRDNSAMNARSKQPTVSATLRGSKAAQSDPEMSQNHSSSQSGGLSTKPLNAYLESASESDSEVRHVSSYSLWGSPHPDVESNPASGTITPRRKTHTSQATEAGPNGDDDRDTGSTETRAAVDKSGKSNEAVTSSERRENLERRFVILDRT